MQYLKIAKESFKALRENWVLLLPTVAIFFIGLFFTLAFLYINGLLPTVLEDVSVLFSSNIMTGASELINDYLGNLLVLKVMASFIIFFATNFLVGTSFVALKFSMMKDVVEGKKANLRHGFQGAVKTYFRTIGMRVFIYLIYFVLALIFSSYLLFVKGIDQTSLSVVAFLIGFAIVIVKIILLFRYPIMFIDNLKPVSAVKKTFIYFLKRKRRVLIVWLIIFVVASIASFIAFMLSRFVGMLGDLLFTTFMVLLISYLFKFIIDLIVDA